MAAPDNAGRAERAVLAVLPRAAAVQRIDRKRGTVPSVGADLVINGQRLVVKWVGEGSLGDVRRLLATGPRVPDVVVGRVMSLGARAELARASIGWVDESSGAAEIAIGSI